MIQFLLFLMYKQNLVWSAGFSDLNFLRFQLLMKATMINTTKYMQKKKCTIFPCHTLKTLEQNPLKFREKERKARGQYHDYFPSSRAGMISLHLCRTASSCCPPGSWQDATECRESFACVIGGVEKKRTLYFSIPPSPPGRKGCPHVLTPSGQG